MYGMVNKALEDMITERFGEDLWEQVKQKAGVDIHAFVSNEGYPDEITYKLVGAAHEVLALSVTEILHEFGRHWVLKTAREGYGGLLDAGGDNLCEFLQNLPNFHARVSLIFPHLQPPNFSVTDVEESSLRLHYYSTRAGLAPFVIGLLDGLGEMFNTPVRSTHEVVRGPQSDHDVFAVHWDR